jgi:hypothetical protein
LEANGVISPNWHILENEAPEEFKQAIRENGCRVELVSPDIHRRNAVERAIQTFKGHYISTLAGVADDFPINQWDQLLPQMIVTLAILRPSNVAPNVSSYAYHHGQFDFNRTPLAPMGCAVQFHNKPNKRKSLGEHSSDGLYIRLLILNSQEPVLAPKFDYCRPIHRLKALVAAFSLMI